jgi:hypothetical protein
MILDCGTRRSYMESAALGEIVLQPTGPLESSLVVKADVLDIAGEAGDPRRLHYRCELTWRADLPSATDEELLQPLPGCPAFYIRHHRYRTKIIGSVDGTKIGGLASLVALTAGSDLFW